MRLFLPMFLLFVAATQTIAGEINNTETQPQVKLQTSLGDIVIQLFPDKAPITVANFLTYVNEGFYDNTLFHRIIPGFMAQGGGMTPKFEKKPTHEPIKNEANNGLKNTRGSVAMARTNNPHSASSQFFINYADNAHLNNAPPQNWGYAVFGTVIEGMDVVDAMAKQPTGIYQGQRNVPKTQIIIEKASVIE